MPVINKKSVQHVLEQAIKLLEDHDLDESRLEAQVLLAHVLHVSRSQLLSHLSDHVPIMQNDEFNRLLERRVVYEPVAYITGHKEFFGLDFIVNSNTLIPRPETELLVEIALEVARSNTRPIDTVIDVGTGCGAIAISVAVNLPEVKLYATDILSATLDIAIQNAYLFNVANRIHFFQGDLLHPFNMKFDMILANLPYVNDDEMKLLSAEIREYEPFVALAGGPKGLDQIGRLLSTAECKLNAGGVIILEIGCKQGKSVEKLAQRYFPDSTTSLIKDHSGNDRVLILRNGNRKA